MHTTTVLAAATLALCLSALTQAAVTDSLSSQGYATDPTGSPIDANTETRGDEQLQEVLGTVVLAIFPTVLAAVPEPPINMAMGIKPLAGGPELKLRVTDSSPVWEVREGGALTYQNFSFSLPPGSYEVVSLEVEANSLSDAPFSLFTMNPRFAVPVGSCVYVGRICLGYMRLPPGSLEQAQAVVQQTSKERNQTLIMTYLQKGALVTTVFMIDMPGDTDDSEALKGSARILAQAREKNCVVELAAF